MTVGQFKEFLMQLAALYESAAKRDLAIGLREFAELFDENQNQRLAKFLEEIRSVRGI